MSGPPYPRPGGAGSNAIGLFQIGVSPIGSLRAFDWWRTVISQYANSEVLMALINNFDDYIDPTANLDAFFDLVMNIDTAQGWGLDVWGRIVGVSRIVRNASDDIFLGFVQQAGPNIDSFGQAPFYSGQTSLTDNFALSDPAYRILILAKALTNISDGSIRSINQILMNLFPNRGNAYVTDNLDMTMAYTFEFVLSPVEVAIVSTPGVLPKPVGVAATIVQTPA